MVKNDVDYVAKELKLISVQIEAMKQDDSFNVHDTNTLAIHLMSILQSTSNRVDERIVQQTKEE